eukprot:3333237-Prymnesium_polylepis.1
MSRSEEGSARYTRRGRSRRTRMSNIVDIGCEGRKVEWRMQMRSHVVLQNRGAVKATWAERSHRGAVEATQRRVSMNKADLEMMEMPYAVGSARGAVEANGGGCCGAARMLPSG